MNKKIVIGLILIIILVLVCVFCIIPKIMRSNTIELTYKTNGGVPYRWEYEIEDDSIVEFVETKNVTPKKYKELDGGLVYINYVFRGLKEGKTTVTFKYVNIVDNSIDKEDKVTLKVDKNKNISLIAIP